MFFIKKYYIFTVYPTSGVLGADCEVVTLAVKKLFTDMPMYNPDTPPLPWRQDILDSTRKLRIGWYDFDGICPATPGVKRAVKEAADKLKVIEWLIYLGLSFFVLGHLYMQLIQEQSLWLMINFGSIFN